MDVSRVDDDEEAETELVGDEDEEDEEGEEDLESIAKVSARAFVLTFLGTRKEKSMRAEENITIYMQTGNLRKAKKQQQLASCAKQEERSDSRQTN